MTRAQAGTNGRRMRRAAEVACAAAALAAPGVLAAQAGAETASTRVVGGTQTAITTAPYQVALYDPSPGVLGGAATSPQNGLFCGGVILDATHVATAAHCSVAEEGSTQTRSTSTVRIVAGASHLRNASEARVATEKDVAVSSIAINPGYDPSTSNRDMAVMTLAEPLYSGAGNAAIAPVSLMSTAQTLPVGSPVRVTGWGEAAARSGDQNAGPVVADLRAATTHLIASTTCAQDYANVDGVAITPQVICAGEPQGGVDACAGDSGGPLTGTIGGQTVLVGLVDFGVGCAQGQFPGVYARIADQGNLAFLRANAPGAQVSTATATPVATTTTTTPASTTKAKPRITAATPRRVRRGRTVTVRVRVRNASTKGVATKAKLRVTLPNGLRLSGSRSRSLGTLAASRTKTVTLRFRTSRSTRPTSTVRLTASGTNAVTRRGSVRVRVR